MEVIECNTEVAMETIGEAQNLTDLPAEKEHM